MSETLPIKKECVVTPLVQSKGFHFNIITVIIVPIIWPFLSKDFRASDYAPAAIAAWSLLGNAIFRVLTRRHAIKLLTEMETELDHQITIRNNPD